MGRIRFGRNQLADVLTQRELEILALFRDHLTQREIAARLVLAPSTIKWYARQIYRKLGVNNRRQAILRAQELGLLGDKDGTLSPPHNLPSSLTPLIGRESDLALVAGLLEDPECHLVTLTGPGGIGKTRLALEAASALLDGFPQGAFFIAMASVTHQDFIVSAIVEALRIKLSASTQPKSQLLDYLQNRHLLLVVDNFEHLLEGSGLLAQICSKAHKVKILVTSRERLHLRGEWVLEVEGLAFPRASASYTKNQTRNGEPSELNQALEAYPAVQMFLASVQRTKVGFRIYDSDYPIVARITQLAEGMPLALELAAGWVSALPLEDIANEMARSIDILETNMQDLSPRQRSMRAAFDHSWQLLSPREKQIFAQLSVFRGGFTRRAAEQIVDVSHKDLMWLVNKSLVKREAVGLFNIHELLRQYASEKLAESPAAVEEVYDRHCTYYCNHLVEWGNLLKGAAQQQALKDMNDEIGNIQFAWKWAIERKRVDLLDLAVDGLCLFYIRRGLYREGLEAAHSAASAMAADASGDEWRVLAHLLGWHGRFSSLLGEYDFARRLFRDSMECLAHPDISPLQARRVKALLFYWIGDQAFMTGDTEEARDTLEQSLALSEDIEDHYLISEVSWTLQLTTIYMQSQPDQAEKFWKRSLAIKRKMGDRFGLASELLQVGSILAFDLGRLEEAERSFLESEKLFRESEDPLSRALMLDCQHFIAKINGRFAEAIELLQKECPIYEELGDRRLAGLVYTYMGEMYLCLGDYDRAERRAREALMILNDFIAPNPVKLLTEWLLGDSLLAQGKISGAKMIFEQSVSIFQNRGGRHSLGMALTRLGRAEFADGHPVKAWEHALEALNIFARDRHYLWCSACLALLSLLLADRGEGEEALEIYSLATRYPIIANSIWYADLYGKYIDEAAARLAVDVQEAAKARARGQDFWRSVTRLAASIPNLVPATGSV